MCKNEKALNAHIKKYEGKDKLHNQYVYSNNLIEGIDYLECKICGLRRKRIDLHLKNFHNMNNISIEKYKKEFSLIKLYCDNSLVKFKEWANSERKVYSNEWTKNYGRFKNNFSPWNKGRKNVYSKETLIKMGKSQAGRIITKEHRNKISNTLKGVPLSENRKRKMREAQKEKRYSRGYGGKRKDLKNIYFRSTTEANFARILDFKNINYKYEVDFPLYYDNKIIWYSVDFYLEDINKYMEIKGYCQSDGNYPGKKKVDLFIEQYPNKDFEIIFCSSQKWKDLTDKYESLIPLWENGNRNIKRTPELYKLEVN